MLEMRDKNVLHNTEVYQSLLSLHRVLAYKTFIRYKRSKLTLKKLHELDSYVKCTLNIPEGCPDDDHREYLSILHAIVHEEETLELNKIAEMHSNAHSIIRLCEIIDNYDDHEYSIDFVFQHTSKASIVRTIIKLLTSVADHPVSIAAYPDDIKYTHGNYIKMMNLLWNENHTWHDGDYETRFEDEFIKYGDFLSYIADSIREDDMQIDKYTEFGRFNHRRKHKKYNFDDLMWTVKNVSMEELTWLLQHMIDIVDIE